MTEKEVIYEIREGIAYITLNRPEKLNAINPEMRELLWEAFQDVEEQPGGALRHRNGTGPRLLHRP